MLSEWIFGHKQIHVDGEKFSEVRVISINDSPVL